MSTTDWMSRYDDLVAGRRLGIRRFVVEIYAEDVPEQALPWSVRVDLGLYDWGAHESEVAVLRFDGAVDLRIRQNWPGLPLGVQIVSIADQQLEGLHYKVTDPEYDIISFLCAGFRIVWP